MKEVRFWINVFLVNKNNILNKNIYKLNKEIITGYFIIFIIIISTFLLKNITPIKFQIYISIVTLTMILIITFINKKLIILGAKKVLNK
jgi:phosphate starvation-inducible membrane PsiE